MNNEDPLAQKRKAVLKFLTAKRELQLIALKANATADFRVPNEAQLSRDVTRMNAEHLNEFIAHHSGTGAVAGARQYVW